MKGNNGGEKLISETIGQTGSKNETEHARILFRKNKQKFLTSQYGLPKGLTESS